MKHHIATLVAGVDAAGRKAFDVSAAGAVTLCSFAEPIELAAKEGRGMRAAEVQALWAAVQTYQASLGLVGEAIEDAYAAVGLLLHALQNPCDGP